jgi:hypothetical protein
MAAFLEKTKVRAIQNMMAEESHAIMWFARTTGPEFEDNYFEVKQHLEYVQDWLRHYAAIGAITYEAFTIPV